MQDTVTQMTIFHDCALFHPSTEPAGDRVLSQIKRFASVCAGDDNTSDQHLIHKRRKITAVPGEAENMIAHVVLLKVS